MLYKYSAKTKDGLVSKVGEVEAPSPQEARRLLQNSGLVVYALVPARKGNGIKDLIYKILGVSIGDKVRFTEQLGSMIIAGLSLTKALDLLSTQTKNPKMVEIVKIALNDVEAGKTLSSSLAKHPTVFNKSYISLMKAGEASGQLGKLLERLAKDLEKQRQFRAKVQGALLYPAIVVIAIVVVFAIVIIFVIPQMSDMYRALDVELPFVTIALIAISEFAVSFWWIILISLVISVYALRIFSKTESGTYFFANLVLKLPIFGSLNQQSALVYFTGTLALLIEAGVPIIEALDITKESANNILFRDAIQKFIEDVKKGFPISVAMSKSELFPSIVPQMSLIGEETGTLGERLNSLSTYFEGEVDKIVKNLSTAIEPFIMVVLGVLVGVLLFAVITPIYSLISDL